MAKPVSRYVIAGARILMGALFALTGANILHPFLPQPASMPAFAGALAATGYMFPMIGIVQLVIGVLLLLNRFVPLALALIAPVVVNIFLFHFFLDRSGLPVAIVVLAIEIFLAWSYRGAYRGMLGARNTPSLQFDIRLKRRTP